MKGVGGGVAVLLAASQLAQAQFLHILGYGEFDVSQIEPVFLLIIAIII